MNLHGRFAVCGALLVMGAALVAPTAASAHGASSEQYEATIDTIKPDDLPIEVRVVDRDQLRVENVGDEELVLCGYKGDVPGGCERYVRLGPDGVFVDENSSSYFANLDEETYGDVPENVGEGGPKWSRVRREPAFYTYHDHRIHWMGDEESLPPGVDDSDPSRQLVNDFTIDLRYGDTPIQVTGRLEYVGGQTWLGRYGEYLLTGGAVLAMLLVFGIDARRRRRARAGATARDDAPKPPRTRGTETILEPDTEDARA